MVVYMKINRNLVYYTRIAVVNMVTPIVLGMLLIYSDVVSYWKLDTYGNIITATARSVIASQELTLNK